ncbi:hypothetical protein [Nocardioides alkalitolerans]|uniref:hypothetical protein n=1 Tax=Nocardioides alkalitolerans TaxID=281714 RepID=UPI0012FB7514|nr:hypothetical protein [Nocardioides alkalitolerans]
MTGVGFRVNPWRHLRRLVHVRLLWHDDGPMGLTNHRDQTISLRRGMSWEERRCTVQHEVLHIERGPQPLGLRAKDEEKVRRETAFLMIPEIRDVLEALLWAYTDEEAAEELGVDVYVLRYRLRHMSPMERAWLTNRFAQAREDHDGVE